ncbi:MAG: ClpXP protease specificity-enhancing factor [Gammaproteobacteria bacterium]|nr:ClpXP protease specificity-enhancing factor [Gammaproteobacteria bacterium]
MTSNRPYLLRALYQWIVDNGMTPHVLVDARDPGAMVPAEHVKDGKIVLNISPQAVPDLVMGDETVTFRARFSGRPFAVRVPLRSLLAIYARENGKGMAFPPESPDTDSPAPEGGDKRPALRVVK